jgi:hypothetical protein
MIESCSGGWLIALSFVEPTEANSGRKLRGYTCVGINSTCGEGIITPSQPSPIKGEGDSLLQLTAER